MAGKPAVNVVISGDTKDLEKALKTSGSALGGFAKTAGGVFGGMLLTKGFDLAVDGLKSVANFALEGVDKLDALGDSVARLDGLAKGLGDIATATDLTKFGVDKGEAAAAALAIAKTGKSLGLTDKQLSRVTPELQEMSAQLASLGDGDPEKQADLLAKALGGSAKAAKELGVELPKGKDVTPMQQYAALMAQLKPKLDTATTGTASLADVQDRFSATMSDLQLELAGMLEKLAPVIAALMDALLPVLREFIEVVGPIVAEVFGKMAEAVSGFLADGGGQQVAGIFTGIMEALAPLAKFIIERVVPVVLDLAGAVAENLAPLLPPLQEAFAALMPILERVWGFVETFVVPLLKNIVLPVLSKLIEIVLRIVTVFLKNLGPALDQLSDDFDSLVDFLKPVIDGLKTIADLAGNALGAIGNIHLPGFNAAPASAGGSGRAGTTPVSITVNTGVGDPVAIGRTVARYLGAYTARGGILA